MFSGDVVTRCSAVRPWCVWLVYCVVRYTGIEAALSIVMGHGGIDNFAQLLKENNLKNVAMVFTDGPVTPYGQVCCTVAGLARQCFFRFRRRHTASHAHVYASRASNAGDIRGSLRTRSPASLWTSTWKCLRHRHAGTLARWRQRGSNEARPAQL